MVEKQYGWFDKREYPPLERQIATLKEFLGESEKGEITLLIEDKEAGRIGQISVYNDNRNKLIDLLGDDESKWAGKTFPFCVEKKMHKGKEKLFFHVLMK